MPSFGDKIESFFERQIWSVDVTTIGRVRAVLIKTLRFLSVAVLEFREGQLALRAMSLVYTTILTLVPLIAVSFSVLKAFGVHNMAEPLLQNFLAPLGPKGDELTIRIIHFVDNVKAGILGVVGLAFLIYSVISLIQKVEDAFNYIWKVQKSRSFFQSIKDYITVLLIGPLMVVAAIGLTATVLSTVFMKALLNIEPFGTAFYYAGQLLPYIIVCVAFSILYYLIPNTRVRFRSALVGGIFAGIIWQTTGWVFASFIVSSAKYSAIYSGFALLILFMMWLYLSWLILLVGGKMSFYHQYPQFLTVKKEHILLSNRLKERLALLIMVLIGHRFHKNEANWTFDALLRRLRLPFEPVRDVLELLERKKLITITCDNPPQYLPTHDLESVKLKHFIKLIRGAEEDTYALEAKFLSEPEVDSLMEKLIEAREATLGEQTLKDIVLKHREDTPAR
ncbi:MAG: YihY/virulence factor BrkB family protein [bacterium]